MEIKYNLFKTAKKTAKENNLQFVDGNRMTDQKLLFDFSNLDGLDIPDYEKEVIKEECMQHCACGTSTAFVMYNKDNFETLHVIADFVYNGVFNEKTGKLLYRIFELKKIKYFHGERTTVYNQYFNENVTEFETEFRTNLKPNSFYDSNDIEI